MRMAIALPMPRLEPVTIATLPMLEDVEIEAFAQTCFVIDSRLLFCFGFFLGLYPFFLLETWSEKGVGDGEMLGLNVPLPCESFIARPEQRPRVSVRVEREEGRREEYLSKHGNEPHVGIEEGVASSSIAPSSWDCDELPSAPQVCVHVAVGNKRQSCAEVALREKLDREGELM